MVEPPRREGRQECDLTRRREGAKNAVAHGGTAKTRSAPRMPHAKARMGAVTDKNDTWKEGRPSRDGPFRCPLSCLRCGWEAWSCIAPGSTRQPLAGLCPTAQCNLLQQIIPSGTSVRTGRGGLRLFLVQLERQGDGEPHGHRCAILPARAPARHAQHHADRLGIQ